jgi:hypothetical protein
MHGQDFSDLWQITDVSECLVAAMRLAGQSAGPTAPPAIRGQDYSFGLPFVEVVDEAPRRPLYDPQTVARLEDALTWQGRYLAGEDPADIDVLKLWLRSKIASGVKFDEMCKVNGWARSAAYRTLDRLRGLIAQGLNTDRAPVWRP